MTLLSRKLELALYVRQRKLDLERFSLKLFIDN